MTSQAPRKGATAIPVPNEIKTRIGLDGRRPAWVVIDEANAFTWPGFDLVPQARGNFVRGVATRGFFALVRDAVLKAHARGQLRIVERDE